jgi:Peptidase M50B-like
VHPPHLPLSAGESVAIGLLTMIVVMIPLLWAAVEHFSTMTHAAYVVAWLLLLSGLRTAIGHFIRSDFLDAADLRSRTHLPGTLWSVVWLAGTALALIVGGKLLVLG